MCSLVGSEDAVTEPYSDLLAISLILIGFLLFLLIVGGAYSSYASKTYAVEHYSDANFLAQKFKGLLASRQREDLLDAGKLDSFQLESLDGWNSRSGLQITVSAGDRLWVIGDNPDFWAIRSSASIPVSISLNPAQAIDGTLRVTLWRR